jgi:hypothetical protein
VFLLNVNQASSQGKKKVLSVIFVQCWSCDDSIFFKYIFHTIQYFSPPLHRVLVCTAGHVGHFRHDFVSFLYDTQSTTLIQELSGGQAICTPLSGRQAICTPNKGKCYIVGCVKITEEITAVVTETLHSLLVWIYGCFSSATVYLYTA